MPSIVDTLDGTDHSALGTTSDGNATWTTVAGVWEHLSNQAHATTASGLGAVASVPAGSADGTVQVTPATNNVGVAFRIVDATHFWVAFANGLWVVNGSFSPIDSYSATLGTEIHVVLSGNSIIVKQGATTKSSQSSSTFATATSHGLFSQATTTSDLLNDFSVVTAAAGGARPRIVLPRRAPLIRASAI